jgi:arsenate reductase
VSVTIYHNPDCGTSRNTLVMIRQSGVEPAVIEYLKTPPSRERLKELIAAMGIPVRALIREKGTPYKELGLDDPKWTDEQLLDQMLAHPILINRPIVVTTKGVKLCRPSEAVLDLLPNPHIGRFVKEDGELIDTAERCSSSEIFNRPLSPTCRPKAPQGPPTQSRPISGRLTSARRCRRGR